AALTLALRPHPGTLNVGWIGTTPTHHVCRVPEMLPPPDEKFQKRMYTGIAILNASLCECFPKETQSCVLRQGVRSWLEEGRSVFGYFDSKSYWTDIGTPAAYLQANFDQLRMLQTQKLVGPHVQLHDSVHLGPNTILGEHVRIGKACTLDHIIAWPYARIPPQQRLSYGIWFDQTWVPITAKKSIEQSDLR
ncbi:MAG: hypothetical protein AAGJ35_12620, partial [Myxococcota bacterium]